MYREIITPQQVDYTIHLPEDLIGKKVEIIAFSIEEEAEKPEEGFDKN